MATPKVELEKRACNSSWVPFVGMAPTKTGRPAGDGVFIVYRQEIVGDSGNARSQVDASVGSIIRIVKSNTEE